MLTSRFPGLIAPPWRQCIKFAIARNKATFSLHRLKWAPLRASATPTKSVWSKKGTLIWPRPNWWWPWIRRKRLLKKPRSTTTNATPTRERAIAQIQRSKPSISPVKEDSGAGSRKISLKKSVPVVQPELEVPEEVFNELIRTPIYTREFKKDSLGRNYELRDVDSCRPAPMSVRIYHPESSSSSTGNKILYLPSEIPNSFFPPHDSIISTLSQITCSTIIYPVPTDIKTPFPHNVHNLLRIHDATSNNAPTAIITSGIAATTATAVAMTEPGIKAIGVWGGIFDLAKFSLAATRWNRPLERWEHLPGTPYRKLPRVPKSTSSLAISQDEFAALRRHYFPNPETWLDPFASPLAFFMRSKVEFSRLNLTEIMGPLIREKMVKMISYRESEWEAEVYIYPRLDLALGVRNVFPPTSREEGFPKIRVVVQEGMGHDDVAPMQAKDFEGLAKGGLADWFKRRKLKSKTTLDTADIENLEADSEEEDELLSKEAKLGAEAMIKVDRLTKEIMGAEEVNTMANWVKGELEKPSTES